VRRGNVDRADSYGEGVKLWDRYRDSDVLKNFRCGYYLSFVVGGYQYSRSTTCVIVGGVEVIVAKSIVFRESGGEGRAKVSFLES